MRPFKFMKKNYTVFLLGLLLAATSCSFTTKKIDPGDSDKEEVLTELVTFVLKNYHYSPKEINDEFSKNVYDEYLKKLDPRKRFFLQSDIDEFSKYRTRLDDQLNNHQVDFFTLTYNRLQKRMKEMQSVYQDIMDSPFDFSKKEKIDTDYEDQDYPKSKKERRERWRKQLKFAALSSYYDLKKEQEDQAEKDEPDEDFEPKTDAEMEKEARKTTRHSLDQFYDITDDIKEKD